MEHPEAHYFIKIGHKEIMNNLKENIIKYYDNVADLYNVKHGADLYGCEWGLKKYYLPLIERFIPKKSEILEIGCGTGKYTEILKKDALRICGIDISANMIDLAKKRNPGVRFSIGDCETLAEFKNEEFDVVAGINTFSYYQDKLKALSSINRVLRKGGIFFDLDMNGHCPIYNILSMIKMNEMEQWHKYIKESTLGKLPPIFKKTGFDVIYKNRLNWIPNALGKNAVSLLVPVDFIFSKLPIIKNFPMRIIIIGRKK